MRDDDWIELQRVHPLLAVIVVTAYQRYRILRPDRTIRVTDGYRTEAAQRRYVALGESQTLNSYHLRGLAVDLAILTADRTTAIWDLEAYRHLNEVMQRAAKQYSATLTWGGDWIKLRDGVHWQLEHVLPTYPDLVG